MATQTSFRTKEPKNQIPVDILLSTGESIKGVLYVDFNTRLFDFMNNPAPFLVVVVKGSQGQNIHGTIINKSHIVTIRERDQSAGNRSLP